MVDLAAAGFDAEDGSGDEFARAFGGGKEGTGEGFEHVRGDGQRLDRGLDLHEHHIGGRAGAGAWFTQRDLDRGAARDDSVARTRARKEGSGRRAGADVVGE